MKAAHEIDFGKSKNNNEPLSLPIYPNLSGSDYSFELGTPTSVAAIIYQMKNILGDNKVDKA